MFNEYPYVNLQDVNLDWILKHIKELEINLQDFVKLNTIKYADPIIWNITKQYETNTVVIDGNTGTAYLSVQPVPSGVALTNTDYWTVIFTLNLTTSNQNITFRDDGTNVVATFASDTGDWLLWNFYLYRVTQPINVNTAYLEGFNLERFSVELFIRNYINTLAAIIGDLDDLTTSDKTSIVDAINSLLTNISTTIGDLDDLTTSDKTSIVDAINSLLTNISTTIGDLDDLTTSDKTSVVNAINSLLTDTSTTIGDLDDLTTSDKTSVVNAINSLIYYVTPEMYGAVGDGLTDDTAAINEALTHNNVLFNTNGVYLVSNALTVFSNSRIIGNGCTIKIADHSAIENGIFQITNKNNVLIDSFTFDSNISNQDGYIQADEYKEFNSLVRCKSSENITVTNCRFNGIYSLGIIFDTCGGLNTVERCLFECDTTNFKYSQMCVYMTANLATAIFNINQNKFTSNVTDYTYGYGGIFMSVQSSKVFINDNEFKKMGRSNDNQPIGPIDIYYNCDNVFINNNYFESCCRLVRIGSSREIIVENNQFFEVSPINPDSAIITIYITSFYGEKLETRNVKVSHNTFYQLSTAIATISISSHYNDLAPSLIDIDSNIFNGTHRSIVIGSGTRNVNITNNIAYTPGYIFVEIRDNDSSVVKPGLYKISNNTAECSAFVYALNNVRNDVQMCVIDSNIIYCITGYEGSVNVTFTNNVLESTTPGVDHPLVIFTYGGTGYLLLDGNATGLNLTKPTYAGIVHGTNFYNGVPL